jgi:hypothetical protein
MRPEAAGVEVSGADEHGNRFVLGAGPAGDPMPEETAEGA